MRLLPKIESGTLTIRFGPFVDDADGHTPETALTITQALTRLSKNNAAFAAKNQADSATHDENGWYAVVLDTTDLGTLGELIVAFNVTGALPVWERFLVVPQGVYDVYATADAGILKMKQLELYADDGLVPFYVHTGATCGGTAMKVATARADQTAVEIDGTGIGLDIAGDVTAAVNIHGDAGDTVGLKTAGHGTAAGTYALGGFTGPGLRAESAGNGYGAALVGGSAHSGVFVQGLNGIEAESTSGDGHGVLVTGNGAGAGVHALGGATGPGFRAGGSIGMDIEGDADAIRLNGKSGSAVDAEGNGNYPVINIHSDSGADAAGIKSAGRGANAGLELVGGATGKDIEASEIGAPVSLGDGASLSDMLTSIAGKTANAGSYDRTTDSNEAIRDRGDAEWVTANIAALNDLDAQEVRDSMKLAPTVGAPAADSVDQHLDDIITDIATVDGKVDTIEGAVTDVIAEPAAGAPAAEQTLRAILGYLWAIVRNKGTMGKIGGWKTFHDSTGTAICKKLVDDDGLEYSEDNMQAP